MENSQSSIKSSFLKELDRVSTSASQNSRTIESLQQEMNSITQKAEKAKRETSQLADLELKMLKIEKDKILAQQRIDENTQKAQLEIEEQINNLTNKGSYVESHHSRIKDWVENQSTMINRNNSFKESFQTINTHDNIQNHENQSVHNQVQDNTQINHTQTHHTNNNNNNERDAVLIEALKSLRSKHVRDLPTFTGNIKEWPIFFSELTRSTRISDK